ncbi:hypothetical protein ACIQ7D_18140 [Streptomyces sp. NPDC096310]|uniref:hypothetical protein n=1 Tax=Streptomyces sp. NPDC096310 TaxID=3366082 RepID=UPI0037F238D8
MTSFPLIPELHVDDCTDASHVACRTLTPSTLYAVDTWLDNANVFTKQYWEQVDGELVITGLRVGHRPDHLLAKFWGVIVRHYDGTHSVRAGVAEPDELTAAQWNAQYPPGTSVTAYPGMRGEDPLTTRTCSKAWTLGGHTPVVMVDGHGACIALTHVDPAEGGVS